jgi:hypothetical protein
MIADVEETSCELTATVVTVGAPAANAEPEIKRPATRARETTIDL